jgi:signal transduction histidine kinase
MRAPLLRRTTISARLLTFSTLFVTIAIILASIILWLIVAGVVREQIDQRLDTQIDALQGTLVTQPDGSLALGASLDGPPFDRIGSGWYWQITGNGPAITSPSLAGRTIDNPPRPLPRFRPGAHPRGDIEGRDSPRHTDPDPDAPAVGDSHDLHLRSLAVQLGAKTLTITATAPQAALKGPAVRALLFLVPAMLVLGLTLVVGTFLQVRYGLQPLKALTADIAAVSAGTLETLPDADTEELRPVSREINRLVAANLERLAETRLHFANLAHGLKTPVASLLLALNEENDPDGDKRLLVARIEERIRHHLARARKTMSAAGLGATTALAPRIGDIAVILTRIHAERALSLTQHIPPGLKVACAPDDLDEVLGNVLDNAFKWARNAVTITASGEGRFVTIVIEDDGPGLPDGQAAKAFLPGVRMDETVKGDGFGLTIAKEICELYGGGITLEKRASGGLRVLLRLPKSLVPAA